MVKVDNFLTFVEEKGVLKGLNLTKELIIKLFAGLDNHRKGYLTLADW